MRHLHQKLTMLIKVVLVAVVVLCGGAFGDSLECKMMFSQADDGSYGYCCMFPAKNSGSGENPREIWEKNSKIGDFRDFLPDKFESFARSPTEFHQFTGRKQVLNINEPTGGIPRRNKDQHGIVDGKEGYDGDHHRQHNEGFKQGNNRFNESHVKRPINVTNSIFENGNKSSRAGNSSEVSIGTRNNINSPVTCTEGKKKTKDGNCEEEFA